MSWVSLWLDREAATARVGLGVTAMISLMTMTACVNATLPKVSYLKSIDIYLGVCLFMAFGVIVEYAIVGYVAKIIRKRKNSFFAVMKINEERKEQDNKQMNNIQVLYVFWRQTLKNEITSSKCCLYFPQFHSLLFFILFNFFSLHPFFPT